MDKVFTEACAMNKGAHSVFCFPEKKALLEALQVEQYGLDMTGEMYLMDVYVVVDTLLKWPPAWSLLVDVFNTKEPWTRPFCDKIMGSPWWQAIPMVRKSFIVPRATLMQLEKDLPMIAAGMNKWLEQLRASGNSQTQQLLNEFKDNDAADAKSRRSTARPLMRLMMQLHAKAIGHILGVACKGSKPALDKWMKSDPNGLTVLHHVASLGDAASAKAILKAIPKASRAEFFARRDKGNYTAADWARLGHFVELVDVLSSFGPKGDDKANSTTGDAEEIAEGVAESQPPRSVTEPLSNFPAASDEALQCSSSGGGVSAQPACLPSDRGTGGWRTSDASTMALEWLPLLERSCDIDAVEIERFNVDVFLQHYVLHPRPLLIKGGGRLPADLLQNFTKQALIDVAGERKVQLVRFPTEQEYDGNKPQVKTLEEYIEVLEQRSEDVAPKKLHFLYTRLPQEESYLNFSAKLPSVLDGKVDHSATNFFLGGTLMGVPPHHKAPTASTLVFGRILWLLEPPGREYLLHDTAYQHFLGSASAPDVRRCVQEAGDLMFVPRHWTSSWLCLSDCVGMTHEFTSTWWDLRD